MLLSLWLRHATVAFAEHVAALWLCCRASKKKKLKAVSQIVSLTNPGPLLLPGVIIIILC